MTRQEVILDAVKRWYILAPKPAMRIPTVYEITFLSGLTRVHKREVLNANKQFNRRIQ